jgi:hypothetical protein
MPSRHQRDAKSALRRDDGVIATVSAPWDRDRKDGAFQVTKENIPRRLFTHCADEGIMARL